MRAGEFLETVVAANVAEQYAAPADIRHAINLILSADAFVGFLSLERPIPAAKGQSRDAALRDYLASRSEIYRLVRDASFALKHGVLTGGARLVRSGHDVESARTGWKDVPWNDDHRWLDEAVFLEVDPATRYRCDLLGAEILAVFREELSSSGRQHQTLMDIRTILG